MYGTQGEMVYPLDDTCIHLAMAKNLALYGVWGIEPGSYAFCSSSPLWTILLAAIVKVFGCLISIPLAVSTMCVAFLAIVVDRFLAKSGMGVWMRLAGAALVGFVAPFAVLSGMGMEHALHTLLVLGVVYSYCARRDAMMCILALLATATRYESLFLLLPLVVAVALERRWRWAVALLLCSVAPAIAYALYAVAHGGHILPNSLLLKVGIYSAGDALGAAVAAATAMNTPSLLMMLIIASMAVLAWHEISQRGMQRGALVAAALAVATAGHYVFVGKFQFYRYEAYLVCAAFTLMVGCSLKTMPKWALGIFLATAAFGTLRGISAIRDEIRAPRDIYLQQVQMARLFASIPESERGPVAINDLGYMCLQCKAPVVDIWGLGTQTAADLHIAANGTFLPENIKKLIDGFGVKYAALFPKWFSPRFLPDSLRHVAVLKNEDNVFCGQNEVWLYANGDDAAKSLSRAAEAYKEKLPPGAKLIVAWRGAE